MSIVQKLFKLNKNTKIIQTTTEMNHCHMSLKAELHDVNMDGEALSAFFFNFAIRYIRIFL